MTTTISTLKTLTVAGALAAGLATFLIPQGAVAQEGWSTNRAETMEAEARMLGDQRDKWDRAAWLYRSAATLRGPGDIEAVEDLQMAARLAWYTEDAQQALTDLERASERAMEGGDVFTSANLLVDAAWVAARSGHHDKARALSDRAYVRVDSPVLSEDVKNLVTERMIDLTAMVLVADAPDRPQD